MEGARIAITDTGPLIALYSVGLLDVLCARFSEVLLPLSVWLELTALPGAAEPAAVRELRCVRLVPDVDITPAALARLDRGEQQALAMGLQLPGTILLMDDGAARKVARELGLEHIGTAGLIAAAKQAGLCGSAGEKYAALLENGSRADVRVINDVLHDLGEMPLPTKE